MALSAPVDVVVGLSVRRRPAPGRLRLAVGGLRRRPDREAEVEAALAQLAGVRLVRASALTGNALVLFDAAVLPEATLLVEGARALLRRLSGGREQGVPDSTRRPARRTAASIPRRRQPGQGGLAAADPGPDHRRARNAPQRRDAGADEVAWHAMDASAVATRLGVDPSVGLSQAMVADRQRLYGPNQLPQPGQPSALRLFLGQFANAPSLLLAAGALLSVATGGIADAVLIGGVLVANASIGAVTERSGNRAIAALRRSVAIRARVRRSGDESVVEAAELVPGDVVKLLPGDPVPADCRLVYCRHLEVEESTLTGESQPVVKQVTPCEAAAELPGRRCMVYRGTTALAGHGEAIVVGTGGNTVAGRLRILAARAKPPPAALERDLDHLGRLLAAGAIGVCGAAFGLTVLRGYGLASAVATAVSLGVAAIPESLAAISTTVLALGSRRMRQKGTLIRTLSAAEALGSVTVVCADKTGTITENRMAAREWAVDECLVTIGGPALSVRGEFRVQGRAVRPEEVPGLLHALRVGALCTDAELEVLDGGQVLIEGSATEGALLVAAAKAGLDPCALRQGYPLVDRRGRGDGRRYMVTVHKGPDGLVAYAKGSPEDILEICDRIASGCEARPLDEAARAAVLARNSEMAGRGLRVLAVAERPLAEVYDEQALSEGFVWRGLGGLVDPIRPAVPTAIQALHRAGVRTVMITGDQAQTAVAVARELQLSRRGSLEALEASELATLPPEVLRGRVRDVGIFARVPPELKLAVVRALQSNGEIVAMTGDGVNDVPALRAADVGIAMGERGTELARELADVVLSTDDFSRFVDAVEEGRLVRCIVRRVLHYLLATNATEVLVVIGSVAVGLPSPLTPLQLLWLNVISDLGPAVGLATEGAPPDLMSRPPRDPRESVVPTQLRRRVLGESAAISVGAIGAYAAGLLRHGAGPVAQTMAFASLTGAQLLHVPLARAGGSPAQNGGLLTNRVLALGVGASVLLQVGAVFFPPLRAALGGARLGLVDALIALAGSVLPIAAIQSVRALQSPGRNRRRARRLERVEVLPAAGS